MFLAAGMATEVANDVGRAGLSTTRRGISITSEIVSGADCLGRSARTPTAAVPANIAASSPAVVVDIWGEFVGIHRLFCILGRLMAKAVPCCCAQRRTFPCSRVASPTRSSESHDRVGLRAARLPERLLPTGARGRQKALEAGPKREQDEDEHSC